MWRKKNHDHHNYHINSTKDTSLSEDKHTRQLKSVVLSHTQLYIELGCKLTIVKMFISANETWAENRENDLK